MDTLKFHSEASLFSRCFYVQLVGSIFFFSLSFLEIEMGKRASLAGVWKGKKGLRVGKNGFFRVGNLSVIWRMKKSWKMAKKGEKSDKVLLFCDDLFSSNYTKTSFSSFYVTKNVCYLFPFCIWRPWLLLELTNMKRAPQDTKNALQTKEKLLEKRRTFAHFCRFRFASQSQLEKTQKEGYSSFFLLRKVTIWT